jgi:hypothetical protein
MIIVPRGSTSFLSLSNQGNLSVFGKRNKEESMKSESRGLDSWQQPTYHNEEGHEACRRILEMDALWRMSDAFESDLYSHDGDRILTSHYVAVSPTKQLSLEA